MTPKHPAPRRRRAGATVGEIRAAVTRVLMGVALFSLAVNVLMLTLPLYMMQVFDRVLASRSIDTLIALSVMALIALVAQGLLDGARSMVLVRVGRWIEETLTAPLLGNAVASAVGRRRGGQPELRNLSVVRGFLSSNGLIPLLDAPWTPVYLAAAFMLNPAVGWLAVGGSALLVAVAVANQRLARGALISGESKASAMTRQAELAVMNSDVIQAMGMLPAMLRRVHASGGEARAMHARAASWNAAFTALSKALRFALQMGVLALGAYATLEGNMTPGAMIAASILVGRALAPIDMAIGSWRSAALAFNAYRSIIRSLGAVPERTTVTGLPDPMGDVLFEDATYLYPGASEPTVRGLSFHLNPGEVTGIVGPAGAGKTTLGRLMVGVAGPHHGHVRLDGVELTHWAPEERGVHVGYLPQDVELFEGTVAANIARMAVFDQDSEIPPGVVQAARLVGAHKLILSLPNGYATQIGHGGTALSGGQRQLVGLARAVFGSPKFVVLDEPNSNLDRDGEAALIHAIETLRQRGTSVVVIAHRPALLQHADNILVLQAGRITMFGPREDVLPKLISVASTNNRVPVAGGTAYGAA